MDPQASSAPIVGRQSELGMLEQELDGLRRGGATCMSVEGEPGIGKTRLLAELRERAEARGHIVLSGTGAEFERELPFGVFVDALDAYVASQELHGIDGWGGELVQVLPSIGGAPAAAGAVADERYRVHRAVQRLLELIARERPLVLILDDLHWGDRASLELIGALVRRPPAAPVLLTLGFRPRQAAEQLVAALAGARVRRLALGQLSEAEAAQLLGAERVEIAAIYSHTGGNPFYLEQLGRATAGAALARPARAAGLDVPAAVSAAIAAELGSLPAQARLFLDAAAVTGERFEPDVAAAVAELPADAGLAALDELLALDVVRPTAVPRRFAFRHPLVRHAVYESARGGWRLGAHARAAAALAARGAAVSERAHHVEQSAAPCDEPAIAILLEAGRATAARAPATAARWFEGALRLLPAGDRERQVDVRLALASACRALGELGRCRELLLESVELLPAAAARRRVELIAQCAAIEHWQGRHAEAHDRLVRAWSDQLEHDTPEGVALQVELAIDGLYGNDYEQTLSMGRKALATARRLGDRGLICVAASALALGESAIAQIGPAREHRGEALAQLGRLGDAELAGRLETLYYLGWTETYLEHYDQALAHADRGIAIARATDQGRLMVPLMLLRGFPLEMQGRLAEANEMCETAVEIARLSPNTHFLSWALSELAWARYYAGDLDGTIAAGEESARVGGRMTGATMPSSGGGPGWAIAVARFELGEVEAAHAMMLEVGGREMEQWIPAERWFNWENLVLAELAGGNLDGAEQLAGRSESSAERSTLALPRVLAGRMRAAVALARGDSAAAADAAERAVAAGERIGAGLQVAFSRGLHGQALAAAGERDRAVAVLRTAEQELDACGSLRMRDAARRELRRLGARAEVRGPGTGGESGVAALTRREREISDLIRDRLTNREIAARLFLSEKTIESHVRNVFIKLGASSRVEVARIIEREREQSTA